MNAMNFWGVDEWQIIGFTQPLIFVNPFMARIVYGIKDK